MHSWFALGSQISMLVQLFFVLESPYKAVLCIPYVYFLNYKSITRKKYYFLSWNCLTTFIINIINFYSGKFFVVMFSTLKT